MAVILETAIGETRRTGHGLAAIGRGRAATLAGTFGTSCKATRAHAGNRSRRSENAITPSIGIIVSLRTRPRENAFTFGSLPAKNPAIAAAPKTLTAA